MALFFPVHGQNKEFRAWAASQGLACRRQPEPMQGEGDIWGVPLMGRKGWLWDAGERQIGLDVRGSTILLNRVAAALAGRPGWHLQTHATDAVVGRIDRGAYSAVLRGVVEPIRARRRSPKAEAEGAKRLKAGRRKV